MKKRVCQHFDTTSYADDFIEMTTFVKRKIPTLPIFFWLQSVVDVKSDCSLQKKGMGTAENCLEKYSEYKQVKEK